MKRLRLRRCSRILILSLLSLSVIAPIVLVSNRLHAISSIGRKEFLDDLSTIKFASHDVKLEATRQETGEELQKPNPVVFEDNDFNSTGSFNSHRSRNSEQSRNSADTIDTLQANETIHVRKLEEHFLLNTVQPNTTQNVQRKQTQRPVQHDSQMQIVPQRAADEKVIQMKDQIIRAKAYLNFAAPGSNLVKELKTRIKEVERILGRSNKDSDLSRGALHKMRAMTVTLSKAGSVYPDCPAMATKLRAMTQNAEEQVRTLSDEESYLVQLAGRTTPKGLHCLSMRLTSEFYFLQPEDRLFPSQDRVHNPDLFHYVIFSDNVLASAAVVNSTVSSALDTEKIVFHVVTDSLNLPAISMWFLLSPPAKAAIQIKSMDNFEWFNSVKADLTAQRSKDPRYTSALNHLRFHLPDMFPELKKIVLLDHDVIVRKDLTKLWSVRMKGRVNAAIETCKKFGASYRQMHLLINFSDPFVAERFDPKACTWAFGVNLFDLQQWRRKNLTEIYHKYLQLGVERPLWRAGTLPLGWAVFYNHTIALDNKWHLPGLGYNKGIVKGEIEHAAVIHYSGVRKPWLEIGIDEYRGYWSKHLKCDHPFLQQCNIHE